MTEQTTSASVSAKRVARALEAAIAYREGARARLREEKIAKFMKPRQWLGYSLPLLSQEQATKIADKNLNEMLGENSEYYSHGYHIREMNKILDLARAAKDGVMTMSAEDFQYVARRYNDEDF
jgi:hypothetical protein